jgi:predicted Zn-dependent protease
MDRNKLQKMFTRLAVAADVRTNLVIVRKSQRNAWTDGDKVYVSTSLVESLPEDQVAAAVAHELGHIIARHVPDTETALDELRARVYKDPGSTTVLSRALIEGAIAVARQYRGRTHEYEADSIGESLTNQAGFGSGKMADTLGQIASQHRTPSILDSHPTTPARIAKLQATRKIRIKIISKR